MIAIVFSSENIASMNMFERFLERGFKITEKQFQGFPLYQKDDIVLARCKQHICYLEQLDELKAEQIIVASSHKSEAGKPLLLSIIPVISEITSLAAIRKNSAMQTAR